MKGVIIKSTGSWYDVMDENQNIYKGRLRGKHKIKGLKVNNPLAVGDRVDFEQETSAESVSITDILPRENYILRKSVHKKGHSHMIAANIDQAILIVTLSFPRTSLGFIDRFLVSAEAFRIPAVLVFNKQDILEGELKNYQTELAQMYESIGYKCLFTSTQTSEGIATFDQFLDNKTSLLSGHSGVGKSTLVNTIAPHLSLKTSEVSTFANKGKHTTTFAEMFRLRENTYIIDTPGIKEMGLAEIGNEELSHYFPEMRDLLGACKFHNCRHINEPGCAVRKQVEEGVLPATRYDNYLSMLEDYDSYR
ncbi:ribosome small subunit-dependent GTPase A [Cytophagaceae bacterium ABcell3]|nr:ribosome small subunit-dependent GTPase A [Cytophagaceae bacterium ABcell3]